MKRYTVNWENDEIVSIEVNGESYSSVADIPDPEDRAAVTTLIDQHYLSMIEADFGTDFDEEFDKDFPAMRTATNRVSKLVAGIFLGIVVLAFAVSIISTVSINRRLAREITASGQVVDLVTRTSQDGTVFYYPVVTFKLANGTDHTIKLSTGSSSPNYAYGETVAVLYAAENPDDARIDSDESTLLVWLLPILTAILGMAFLIPAVIILWSIKPRTA